MLVQAAGDDFRKPFPEIQLKLYGKSTKSGYSESAGGSAGGSTGGSAGGSAGSERGKNLFSEEETGVTSTGSTSSSEGDVKSGLTFAVQVDGFKLDADKVAQSKY